MNTFIPVLSSNSNPVPMEPLLLTISRVAQLLDVCPRTVRNLVKKGDLSVCYGIGKPRITTKSVYRFVYNKNQQKDQGKKQPKNTKLKNPQGQYLPTLTPALSSSGLH